MSQKTINEDKITKVIIDLNAMQTGQINEAGFLGMFGWVVEKILGSMFGGGAIPVQVKGNPAQISSFANTLASEKRYMDSFLKHGLNDAQTTTSRYQLDGAVKQFEFETGLRWPFTH